MIVAVVGLGYVGLPLAMAYADAGAYVIGIDIDRERVEKLKKNESYVSDVSDATLIANADRFFATSSYEYIGRADAIFVCVPTPYDSQKHPDLSCITSAGDSIGKYLQPKQVIILQSTSWPGTTGDVFFKSIAETITWEMCPSDDAPVLAFSSERVNPGSGIDITDVTKVVGVYGREEEQRRVLDVLHFAGFKTYLVSSPEVAETSKLLENTFRAVNIALANEIAILCEKMEIDVWEVIDAAATKPYGFMPFYPGPGVGGHCIPIDPYYLQAKAMEFGMHMRSIETAMAINEGMPEHVAKIVREQADIASIPVTCRSTILVGKSYKPGTNDQRGATWKSISPLLDNARAYDRPDEKTLQNAMIAVILIKDEGYDYTTLIDLMPVVVDCCNATAGMANTYRVKYLGAGWGHR